MITSSFSRFKSGGMVVNASAVIYLALSTSSGESGTLMLYSSRLIIFVSSLMLSLEERELSRGLVRYGSYGGEYGRGI